MEHNIKDAIEKLDTINTIDIRDNINDLYHIWKDIHSYIDNTNDNRNRDLLDNGKIYAEIKRFLEEAVVDNDAPPIFPPEFDYVNANNFVKSKIYESITHLQELYDPDVEIDLYDSNSVNESRQVGGAIGNMGKTCCFYAYIKTADEEGKKVKKAHKNELEPIIITHWSEKKIEYQHMRDAEIYEETIAEVKKEDYLVLDNHYQEYKVDDCGTRETQRFEKFNVKEKHIIRLRLSLQQRGLPKYDESNKVIGYNKVNSKNVNKEVDAHFKEERLYRIHLYNYMYFDKEFYYYLNKTRSEYELVTNLLPGRSYYRLIYYYYECVKTLDKKFLQRIQLSKNGHFYSGHSWWRSMFGGSWSITYFNLLREQYAQIMGDLKSGPLQIIKKLEVEFLREITNMNKMRNNFNLQNPLHIPGQKSVTEDQYNDIIVKNKKLIHNLRSSFEHLWNSVKEE